MTRFFVFSLFLVLCVTVNAAEENASRTNDVFVDGFGESSKSLTSDQAITNWLDSELKQQLNLGASDELSLSEQSTTINNFNIRCVLYCININCSI